MQRDHFVPFSFVLCYFVPLFVPCLPKYFLCLYAGRPLWRRNVVWSTGEKPNFDRFPWVCSFSSTKTKNRPKCSAFSTFWPFCSVAAVNWYFSNCPWSTFALSWFYWEIAPKRLKLANHFESNIAWIRSRKKGDYLATITSLCPVLRWEKSRSLYVVTNCVHFLIQTKSLQSVLNPKHMDKYDIMYLMSYFFRHLSTSLPRLPIISENLTSNRTWGFR